MIYVDWLLLFGCPFAIILSVLAFLAVKQNDKKHQSTLEQLGQLEQKVSAMSTGAIGMGHRILALEGKLNSIAQKEEASSDVDSFAYTQAKQMFAQGADTETVASNCGFSNSEAELMALIQKRISQEDATQTS